MKEKIAYIDMDDTACAFTEGLLKYFGAIPDPQYYGDKHFAAKCIGVKYTDVLWSQLNNVGFWSDLKPTYFFDSIIDIAKEQKAKVVFLTKFPQVCPASLEGKLEWKEKHYPKADIIMTSADNKYLLANEGSILFDDKVDTINDFIREGGSGCRVPSLTNSLYKKYLSLEF